jgi:hypothetical protein
MTIPTPPWKQMITASDGLLLNDQLMRRVADVDALIAWAHLVVVRQLLPPGDPLPALHKAIADAETATFVTNCESTRADPVQPGNLPSSDGEADAPPTPKQFLS